MTEKKRKRYPADRQKLHALLEKREQEPVSYTHLDVYKRQE